MKSGKIFIFQVKQSRCWVSSPQLFILCALWNWIDLWTMGSAVDRIKPVLCKFSLNFYHAYTSFNSRLSEIREENMRSPTFYVFLITWNNVCKVRWINVLNSFVVEDTTMHIANFSFLLYYIEFSRIMFFCWNWKLSINLTEYFLNPIKNRILTLLFYPVLE